MKMSRLDAFQLAKSWMENKDDQKLITKKFDLIRQNNKTIPKINLQLTITPVLIAAIHLIQFSEAYQKCGEKLLEQKQFGFLQEEITEAKTLIAQLKSQTPQNVLERISEQFSVMIKDYEKTDP